MDDQMIELHLFLSILFLMLLLRLIGITPMLLDVALFSCVSTPAMYALMYYHKKAKAPIKMGKFIVKKSIEPMEAWQYEFLSLVMSYAMGLMVFIAFTNTLDLAVYTIAFIAVQAMRLLTILITRRLKAIGINVQHPLTTTLASLLVATITLAVIMAIYPFFDFSL